MEVQVDTLCLLPQPKEGQQQFKNKKQPELTENRTVWKSDNRGEKEETFIQTGRGAEMGSRAERTRGKAAAGGPSEVADCGTGWAKLQLALEAAAGEPGDRPHDPGLQVGEIKPQTTD